MIEIHHQGFPSFVVVLAKTEHAMCCCKVTLKGVESESENSKGENKSITIRSEIVHDSFTIKSHRMNAEYHDNASFVIEARH